MNIIYSGKISWSYLDSSSLIFHWLKSRNVPSYHAATTQAICVSVSSSCWVWSLPGISWRKEKKFNLVRLSLKMAWALFNIYMFTVCGCHKAFERDFWCVRNKGNRSLFMFSWTADLEQSCSVSQVRFSVSIIIMLVLTVLQQCKERWSKTAPGCAGAARHAQTIQTSSRACGLGFGPTSAWKLRAWGWTCAWVSHCFVHLTDRIKTGGNWECYLWDHSAGGWVGGNTEIFQHLLSAFDTKKTNGWKILRDNC